MLPVPVAVHTAVVDCVLESRIDLDRSYAVDLEGGSLRSGEHNHPALSLEILLADKKLAAHFQYTFRWKLLNANSRTDFHRYYVACHDPQESC